MYLVNSSPYFDITYGSFCLVCSSYMQDYSPSGLVLLIRTNLCTGWESVEWLPNLQDEDQEIQGLYSLMVLYLMSVCCGWAVLWNTRGQPLILQCMGTSTSSSPDTCTQNIRLCEGQRCVCLYLAHKAVVVISPHVRVCCDGEGVGGEGEEGRGWRIHHKAAATPLTQETTHIV